MADSIPLDDLPNVEDQTRRDRYGRYLVVPPAGGPPIGYSRATTIAKVLDSGGGLASWKAAMTVQGLLLRSGLRAQWEALMNQEHGDPWYNSQQGKARAKALVEECAAVGGASDRAQIGLALHAITALMDAGQAPSHLTPETKRDIEAYQSGLKSARLEVVPRAVELTVVLDAYQVAGTFDRLLTMQGRPLPLVSDLKTGGNLDYSFQSFAVQLAIYSRGDFLYRQGDAPDGSKDERLPMPEVDQEYGLILHLNAGTGELAVYTVDLVAGWEAFTHSLWARSWRNSKPYLASLPPVIDLEPALEESLRAAADAKAGITRSGLSQKPDHPSSPAFLRDWLQGRINTIGGHTAARAELMVRWPKGVAPLKAGSDHTEAQLKAIDELCWSVEKRYELPFPPSKPGEPEAVGRVVELFPGSTVGNGPGNDSPPTVPPHAS
jgi:hypothetical protein